MTPEPALLFGPFRLDPASGHLYRDETIVPLTPKAFAVLGYLTSRGGQLVGKQELLTALWPGVFVGDAVLKVAINEIRKALGDQPRDSHYIETAYRRGYRFIAPIAPAPAAPPRAQADEAPPVRYARSGSINIAYQVIGDGPIDLVFVMGWVSHLEYFWRDPDFARFLRRLSGMGRLILFDKRGTGRSDPVPVSQLPTLDERLDDVRAVMEAAGSERAVLVGVSEGGPLCTLFAATYPEKTEALIMIGSYARRLADVDYSWGQTPEEHQAFCDAILEGWGGPVGIEDRAPSRAQDPVFREWWASYLRMGASPGAAVALTRMNAQIDVRDVLPFVPVPTLVLHRTGDRCLRVEEGRYLASQIPGASFVELPGEDHLPFAGDQDTVLDAIGGFLRSTRERADRDRVLATMLVVASDCQPGVRDHLAWVFAREVASFRGRPIARTDGRLVATFDGPGRAVRCGRSVAAIAARSAIPVQAGVHIGECDPAAPDGALIETATALAASAAPGEVLVSRTVVDLVPGSGLTFADRGAVEPAGEVRPLAVFAARA